MAKGGKRPGAGRKPGKTLAITDHFKQKDIDQFIDWLKEGYMDDSRVAIWIADHLFGKAPQPIVGPEGGPIQVEGVEIKVRK